MLYLRHIYICTTSSAVDFFFLWPPAHNTVCAQNSGEASSSFPCDAVDIGACGGGSGGDGAVKPDDDEPTAGTLPPAGDSTTAAPADSAATLPPVDDISATKPPVDSATDTLPPVEDSSTVSDGIGGGGDRGITTTDSSGTTGGGVPVDGTTTSTDTTTVSTNPCQAEQEACAEDAECITCADGLDAADDAVEAICQSTDFDLAAATCAEASEVGCCTVEEGPACVATNAAMAALIGGWVGPVETRLRVFGSWRSLCCGCGVDCCA